MQWLAENAETGYFLLGFAAFMLAGLWWVQKQVVYLVAAGAALAALLVFWLVIRTVPTAAVRIEGDLQALAKAVLDKKDDVAARYVVDGFKYNRKTTEKWLAYVHELIDENSIEDVAITDFKLKKRDGNEARVAFHIVARAKGKTVHTVVCPDWTLVREGDAWQVSKVHLSRSKDDD